MEDCRINHSSRHTLCARQLVFDKLGDPAEVMQVKEVPLPKPERRSPRACSLLINPSDLMFVQGLYGRRPELPTTAGFERGVVEGRTRISRAHARWPPRGGVAWSWRIVAGTDRCSGSTSRAGSRRLARRAGGLLLRQSGYRTHLDRSVLLRRPERGLAVGSGQRWAAW